MSVCVRVNYVEMIQDSHKGAQLSYLVKKKKKTPYNNRILGCTHTLDNLKKQ